MHILVTLILDRKVEEAVKRFSQLPYLTTILSHSQYEKILLHGKMFLSTYIKFLQTVNLIPKEFAGYYRRYFIINSQNQSLSDQFQMIDEETQEAIRYAINNSVGKPLANKIPVFYRYNNASEMMLISGLLIRDENNRQEVGLLHQIGIPQTFIEFTSYKTNYLISLLEDHERNPNLSIRKLAARSGRSYKLLQKDCKLYFGTTFHSFFLKIKMLDVLNDIMFTDLSLKEIAFKNDFADYSNMYRRFHKQYHFPLNQVPRFLNLI